MNIVWHLLPVFGGKREEGNRLAVARQREKHSVTVLAGGSEGCELLYREKESERDRLVASAQQSGSFMIHRVEFMGTHGLACLPNGTISVCYHVPLLHKYF